MLGLAETDFLGNAAATLNTASNSATLRMRLYFADVTIHSWEILAGQSWSLLTPNRNGISPIPSDIFYTMDMDANYQAGLTWARQPQLRVGYHLTDQVAVAVSAENPDPYVGTGVVLPGAIAGTTTQAFNAALVDNGGNTPNAPSSIPDLVKKMTFDPKLGSIPVHLEVAGLFATSP